MLKIENLCVEVNEKIILKDINLDINNGEVHVLFGPNGAGKSTLINTILGNPKYKIVSGKIYFNNKDITDMPINERAKLGIGISYQSPPAINGVKLKNLLKIINKRSWEEVEEMVKLMNFEKFMDRDVNVGFSGGEVKRSEIIQLYAQNPNFIMFDEPDSGVDVENIELIGKTINKLLEKDKKICERTKSGLIITHMGHILDYIDVDKAHVLTGGVIACSGNPKEILENLINNGYKRCVACYQKKKQN